MIIDLRTIPREGTWSFQFCLDKDWWHPYAQNDQVLGLDTPLTVKVDIYKAGEKYVLKGHMKGFIQLMCDRCLVAYSRDIDHDFKVILAPLPPDSEKAEVELHEEDMEIGFIKGEEIDLGAIIQEQLYLSLPIKSLCREDCLGLCSLCGANLNHGDCGCRMEHGHTGFSKLRSLKIERE